LGFLSRFAPFTLLRSRIRLRTLWRDRRL
jgi:hypothetical protein